VEQAIFYYVRKCFPTAVNREFDERTGVEPDVLIPDKCVAIEYSCGYTHRELSDRTSRDIEKLHLLARYYRVFSLQDYRLDVDYPLIKIVEVPEWRFNACTKRAYNDVILALLRDISPREKNYPNVDVDRDCVEILCQYVCREVKGSFEEKYPLLANDWDTKRNGTLTPSMFRHGTGNYKFWWVCRRCGHSYRASMVNRVKVNPDRCPLCARNDEEKVTLGEAYPQMKLFWHDELNDDGPDEIQAYSERTRIFRLLDGRVAPVRVCDITYALKQNPQMSVNAYLENILDKTMKARRAPRAASRSLREAGGRRE
jgi:predicted Zn-ribbon and HTH transcriptional regulator